LSATLGAVGLVAPIVLGVCGGLSARAASKGPCSNDEMVAITDACCPPVVGDGTMPPGCADVAACTSACDGGDAVACLRGGDMVDRAPLGKGRDHAQALVLLDKGCRLGDCRACWNSATRLRGDYAGLRDLAGALAHDEAGCRAGDPNACRQLASVHLEDGRYAAFEQRACDLGSAPACVALLGAYSYPGNVNASVLGVENTPGAYQKVTARACELGHVSACIGTVTSGGGPWPLKGLTGEPLVAAQWKLASDKLDPFCRRGEGLACLALGQLHRELDEHAAAKPANWSTTLGLQYLEHACSLKDANGCYELGVARLHVAHFEGPLRDAKAAFNRSCGLGLGRGCVALSQLTPDRKRAQELIDSGCAHGMRGPLGVIYTNAGLPELPQPLQCRRGH
jgi:TPR repeat protein